MAKGGVRSLPAKRVTLPSTGGTGGRHSQRDIGNSFQSRQPDLVGSLHRGSIRDCASHVCSVSVRDAVRDLARRRGFEVEIGRGSAEFAEILGVLEEQRFGGWYIIDRPGARQPVPEIANALEFLKAL